MGCMESKPKYDVVIEYQDKPYHLNIYKESEDKYVFTGVLKPDLTKFFLVFMKEDEEKLPLAISFDISDDDFTSHQYRFLKPNPDKSIDSLENITIQFPDKELSYIYSCEVSPSFPFVTDIRGEITLKNVNE